MTFNSPGDTRNITLDNEAASGCDSLVSITANAIDFYGYSTIGSCESGSVDLAINIDQTLVVKTPSFSSDSIYNINNDVFRSQLMSESSVKGMEGMINNWSTISGDLAAYSADRVAHDNAYSAAKNNVASASKALASAEKLLSAYRADSAGGAIDAWIQGYTVSADAAALSKAKAAQGIESGMAATFSTAGAQALSSIYNALGIKSGGMSIDQLKSLQNLGYTKVESQLQYQNQYCQQLSTYATSQKDEAEKYQSADESYSSACQQLVSNESGLLSLLTNLVSS